MVANPKEAYVGRNHIAGINRISSNSRDPPPLESQGSTESKTPIVPATSSIYVFRSRYEGRLKELHQEERYLARKCGSEPLKDQVQRLQTELSTLTNDKRRLEVEMQSATEKLKKAENSLLEVTHERDSVKAEASGDIECLRAELSTLKKNHDTTLLELEEKEAQVLHLTETINKCREQANSELEDRQQFAEKLKEQYERALESKDYELRKLHNEKMRESEQKAQLARELHDAKVALKDKENFVLHVTMERDRLQDELDKNSDSKDNLQHQLSDVRDDYDKVMHTIEEKDAEISQLRQALRDLEERASAELDEGAAIAAEEKQSFMTELELKQFELNELQSEKTRLLELKVELECQLSEAKHSLNKISSELQKMSRDRDNAQDELERIKRALTTELDDVREDYQRAEILLQGKHSELEQTKRAMRSLEQQYEGLIMKSSELMEQAEEHGRLMESKDAVLRDALQLLEQLKAERDEEQEAAFKIKEDHERELEEKESQLRETQDRLMKRTAELEQKVANVTEIKDLRERSVLCKEAVVQRLECDLQERSMELEKTIAAMADLKQEHKAAMEAKDMEVTKALSLVRQARKDLDKCVQDAAQLKEQNEQAIMSKELYIQELQQTLEKTKARLESTVFASRELQEELDRSNYFCDAELKDVQSKLDKSHSELQVTATTMTELEMEYQKKMTAKESEIGEVLETSKVKDRTIERLKEALTERDDEIARLNGIITSKQSGSGSNSDTNLLLKLTCSLEKLCRMKGCKEMVQMVGAVGALADVIESHHIDSDVSRHARKAMAELMMG